MTRPAGLRSVFRTNRFVVTTEIGVPHGADATAITSKARQLAGYIDAANITDNPSANVLMSSLAGSIAVQRGGVEPVMQLTCRDRNRIALQSDLLGAAALGVPNVLLLTGDHPRFGDHPGAKPVFDVDSIQLAGIARTMRDSGQLMSGKTVEPRPSWTIGAVENPFAPPTSFRALRLAKKVAAGAEFIQTQFVFDIGMFGRWMREVCDLQLTDRCAVLAGLGPVRSPRALEFLRSRVPGVYVPDDVYRRLASTPSTKFAAEAMRLCVETLEQLREMPGVRGVHIMAFGREDLVPEILERAGLARTVSAPLPARNSTAGDSHRLRDAIVTREGSCRHAG
jgi:methylenetetrahydrofolate reductase (NADPH)